MIKIIQLFEDGDFQRKLLNATRTEKNYLLQMVNPGVYFETHSFRRHNSIYLFNNETVEYFTPQLYELSIQNNLIYVYADETELNDQTIHDIADQFFMYDFSNVKLHASLAISARNMTPESGSIQKPLIPGKLVNRASNAFNSLLNSMNVGIFAKDRASKYRVGNQQFLTDFGLESIDDLQGKTDSDLLEGEAAVELSAFDAQVLASSGEVTSYDKEVLLAHGGKEWLRFTKIPIVDQFGRVNGIMGHYEKIDRLKSVEVSTQKNATLFKAFLHFSNEKMAFKNPDGVYELANQAYIELFQLSKIEEIQGKTDFDFLESESARSAYSLEQQLILERKQLNDKLCTLVLKNNVHKHVSLSKIPIYDELNNPLGVVIIANV